MKNKIQTKILFFSFLLFFIPIVLSCDKGDDEIEDPSVDSEYMNVQPLSLSFGSTDKNTKLFFVDTNAPYKIKANASWINVTQSEGYWTVTVSPNLEDEPRSAEIVVTSNNTQEKIIVSQEKYIPYLEVSNELIYFYDNILNTIRIKSNEDWSAHILDGYSWIDISLEKPNGWTGLATDRLVSGNGDQSIWVCVNDEARLPFSMRLGQIAIKGEKSGKEITVTVSLSQKYN